MPQFFHATRNEIKREKLSVKNQAELDDDETNNDLNGKREFDWRTASEGHLAY